MSAILEAKEKIYDTLKASEAAELSGVAINWGVEKDFEEVVIWHSEADRDFATIGRQPPPLDETYNIGLVVNVIAHQSGRDARSAEVRAWAIAAAVQSELRGERSDRTLFHRPAKVAQEGIQTDKGTGCRIKITLTGKARI